jgi:cob(I)alamin adenosyltransferase
LIVELNSKEKINIFSMTYVNRLSDLFFVLSRVENGNGKKDVLWKPGQNT